MKIVLEGEGEPFLVTMTAFSSSVSSASSAILWAESRAACEAQAYVICQEKFPRTGGYFEWGVRIDSIVELSALDGWARGWRDA